MEQLDAVYKVFTNLDRGYARSNKTRTEYIESKFGGDISTGMFLILNALNSCELSDPEDIEKLSRIREIFDGIRENKDHLDSLSDFSFKDSGFTDMVLSALDEGEKNGLGVIFTTQQDLYAKQNALHFKVGTKTNYIAPLQSCSTILTMNEHLQHLVSQNLYPEGEAEFDTMFAIRDGNFVAVDTPLF